MQKGGQKVKDFSDSSPRVRGRLLLAAITSPTFGQWGGGRPVHPCLDSPLLLQANISWNFQWNLNWN